MQTLTTAEMRKKLAWCDKLMDRLSGDARGKAIEEWNEINDILYPMIKGQSEVVFSVPGRYFPDAEISVFRYSDGLYAYSGNATVENAGYGSGFHREVRKTKEEAISEAKRYLRGWCERHAKDGSKRAKQILAELNKSTQKTLF